MATPMHVTHQVVSGAFAGLLALNPSLRKHCTVVQADVVLYCSASHNRPLRSATSVGDTCPGRLKALQGNASHTAGPTASFIEGCKGLPLCRHV